MQLNAHGLCLRPFVASDAALFAVASRESVATVGRWLPWCTPDYGIDDARIWFAHCDAARANASAYEFGIFAADGLTLLGGVGLNSIDPQRRCANLGYWVRQSRQRSGVATRAIHIIRDFAFDKLKLARVEILACKENQPSNAAAITAGAHFEGYARNGLMLNDAPQTAAVYSLIPASSAGSATPHSTASAIF